MNKLRLYFQGVMSEVKKVTFPSQEETKANDSFGGGSVTANCCLCTFGPAFLRQ